MMAAALEVTMAMISPLRGNTLYNRNRFMRIPSLKAQSRSDMIFDAQNDDEDENEHHRADRKLASDTILEGFPKHGSQQLRTTTNFVVRFSHL